MATSKTNQLDIDLNVIQDANVRSALSSIVTFVNQLTSFGLSTDGPIEAREYALAGNDFGLDRNGNLSVKTLGIDGQGQFKTMIRQGSLAKSSSITFKVPGTVLGVLGYYNSKNTNAVGLHPKWRIIPRDTTSYELFFSVSGSYNEVILASNDDTNSSEYNVLIFHLGLS